jgi:hypothetical protein
MWLVVGIGDALRRHHHRAIGLAPGLQPFTQLLGKDRMGEHLPGFIEQQQARPPIHRPLDAAE